MKRVALALLAFAASSAHAQAGRVWFENEFVRVTGDAAPCATPATRECGDRAIVAMGDMEIVAGANRRTLARGDIVVFAAGEAFSVARGNSFFEVVVKPDHPASRPPSEIIAAPNNALVADRPRYLVYTEQLPVGATRERHSHSQRIEIRINQGPQLRQRVWRDGKESQLLPQIVNWREPMVHEVTNTGDAPLRNFILEFKPGR